MLFNSYEFAVFLIAVLGAYRTLPARMRNTALLVASLIFYTMWIPQYLLLFVGDVALNYILLRGMIRSRQPRRWLLASLVVSLGLLAYFKYAAFLLGSIAPLVHLMSHVEIPTPDILLPLGISFFTFQLLALSIDVYRGKLDPPQRFSEYLLFICFFPQLIAGPILRGSQFLPQLRRGGQMNPERSRRGAWLIGVGLLKKAILADALLAPFTNRVFDFPGFASAPVHLIAIYSFAFQIYFDFSGYTDIARGIGLLLGFELPKNFTEPYLSRNPAEFWRRWHITLSRWLRDYLYIPLGGNRARSGRVYLNLMITMLLGGLWHGAGWNFVIWGGLHGLLLVAHRRFRTQGPLEEQPIRWRDLPRMLWLFHAVCLLWIFFRAATFGDAMTILTHLFTGSYLGRWPVMQCGIVVLCGLMQLAERQARLNLAQVRQRLAGPWGAVVEGGVLGAVAGLVVFLGGAGGEFIYFQF